VSLLWYKSSKPENEIVRVFICKPQAQEYFRLVASALPQKAYPTSLCVGVRWMVGRGVAAAESNGGLCLLYECGCVRDCSGNHFLLSVFYNRVLFVITLRRCFKVAGKKYWSGKPDPLALVPCAKGERPEFKS
jgi:hypothetical protein